MVIPTYILLGVNGFRVMSYDNMISGWTSYTHLYYLLLKSNFGSRTTISGTAIIFVVAKTLPVLNV